MTARPPGDLDAFCRREYPRLVGTLSLYCGDRHLAEELAQEALARACGRWAEVSQMHAPGAWVHRVGINAANSYWRRLRAGRRAQARLQSGAKLDHHDPDSASDDALRRAVAELPDRQRTALVLRYFAEMSVPETASTMGISDQAVRNLTHRAVARLREDFAVHEPTEEVSDVR